MSVLATGGAGYVGSACVRSLLTKGFDVWVYDDLSTGYAEAVPTERLIEGDLADRRRVCEVLADKKVDSVMHFAGSISVGESVGNPCLYYNNNVGNSLVLLSAMLETGVKKILFSSTAGVYGPVEEPLTEDSPKEPDNPYAFSKYAVERMIQDFAGAYGLGYCILRYFNAAGASADGRHGESHRPETHLIPLVLKVALGQREAAEVFGSDYDTPDGTCIRDYIHIDDLAEAHISAIQSVQAGRGSIYNVGTGTGHSVLEVIGAAEEVLGKKITVKFAGRRAGDSVRLVADAGKLHRELGWEAKHTSLRTIVESAWRWHCEHPDGYGAQAGRPATCCNKKL